MAPILHKQHQNTSGFAADIDLVLLTEISIFMNIAIIPYLSDFKDFFGYSGAVWYQVAKKFQIPLNEDKIWPEKHLKDMLITIL